MASYNVKIVKSAQKEIRKLPGKDLRNKIVSIIDGLYTNPMPEESKKIKGSKNIYRIRQGAYRVIYKVEKDELFVTVIRVRNRKDAYRGM